MTLTVDSNLNGDSPQFTLTCISTGGPATTVTWTRDSATAMGDAVTVFNHVTTASYTHTLTVTGRLGGDYQCTVSNVKPSSPSASLRIQGTAYKLLHCNSVHTYMSNDKPSSRLASFTVQGTCTYIALHGARMILHVTCIFECVNIISINFRSCCSSQ